MDKIEKIYQNAMEEIKKEEKIRYEYNTRITFPNIYEAKGYSLFVRRVEPLKSRKAQESFFADADFTDLKSITDNGLNLEEQVTEYFNLVADDVFGYVLRRIERERRDLDDTDRCSRQNNHLVRTAGAL